MHKLAFLNSTVHIQYTLIVFYNVLASLCLPWGAGHSCLRQCLLEWLCCWGRLLLQKSPCWWYRMCTSNFQICLQRIAKLWNVIVNPQGDTAWQCHKRERAAEPVASFYMHEVATCIGDDPHICLPATSPKWLVGRCEDQSPVNHLSKYHLCQIRIQGHLTHQTNTVQSSLTADDNQAYFCNPSPGPAPIVLHEVVTCIGDDPHICLPATGR